MSNLLNNGKPRKRLLERGPKIVPEQEFKLDVEEENELEGSMQLHQLDRTPKQASAAAPTSKRRESPPHITSVRVTKQTRNKLNALIQMGKAENVDILIDILMDEYIENNLVKDEKKTFNLVLDIIQKRDR